MPSKRSRDAPQQLLIQIDGLSRPALERALSKDRLPTLSRLAGDEGSRLVSVYAGLPSTTPAAQGELFYGVRGCVPAFAFLQERSVPRHMLDPESAAAVQRRLEREDSGLLAGGSSYCNIYTGGAAIAMFCPAELAGSPGGPTRSVRYRLRAIAGYAGVALRALGMTLGEVLRLVLRRKPRKGIPLRRRIEDSWNRILATIVLRDSARLAALHDLRAGLPVVHVNFLGYDKQAHRYGPDSAPARRALKGIDKAIGSLVAECESGEGACTAVVYSDHGQETTTPLRRVAGRGIEEIVRDAVRAVLPREAGRGGSAARRGGRSTDQSLSAEVGERVLGIGTTRDEDESGRTITTVESGPIAHVYIDGGPTGEQLIEISRAICADPEGVAVLVPGAEAGVTACSDSSRPVPLADFCGERLAGHPFASSIACDLERLARHPDAGDLVLLSTGFGARPLTFAEEHGSHGGPGAEETHAFAIVPRGLDLGPAPDGGPVRFEDLRRALLAERAAGTEEKDRRRCCGS